MADEFTMETGTVDAIGVRHVPHGHRYMFAVREQNGWRLLRTGRVIGNAKASVPARMLRDAARALAEREPRKAKLID
jgi:hypothetical protein